jgi:hypothetical protein
LLKLTSIQRSTLQLHFEKSVTRNGMFRNYNYLLPVNIGLLLSKSPRPRRRNASNISATHPTIDAAPTTAQLHPYQPSAILYSVSPKLRSILLLSPIVLAPRYSIILAVISYFGFTAAIATCPARRRISTLTTEKKTKAWLPR